MARHPTAATLRLIDWRCTVETTISHNPIVRGRGRGGGGGRVGEREKEREKERARSGKVEGE